MNAERREKIKVPVLGFAAVLVGIGAFLIVLYLVTIAIRLIFALG